MKLLAILLTTIFLGACSSKPKLMKDCVKADNANIFICKDF